jgi:hypothetical protein
MFGANSVNIIIDIAGCLSVLLVVLGSSQFLGPRCAKYHVTENSIEFILFRVFRVWRTPIVEIVDIRRIPFAALFVTPALNLMNRPFGKPVLLKRRRGIFRWVTITPDDPDELTRSIREKVTTPPEVY